MLTDGVSLDTDKHGGLVVSLIVALGLKPGGCGGVCHLLTDDLVGSTTRVCKSL